MHVSDNGARVRVRVGIGVRVGVGTRHRFRREGRYHLIVCIGSKPHDSLDTHNTATHPFVVKVVKATHPFMGQVSTIMIIDRRLLLDCPMVGASVHQSTQQKVQSTGVEGFVGSKYQGVRTRARTRVWVRTGGAIQCMFIGHLGLVLCLCLCL